VEGHPLEVGGEEELDCVAEGGEGEKEDKKERERVRRRKVVVELIASYLRRVSFIFGRKCH